MSLEGNCAMQTIAITPIRQRWIGRDIFADGLILAIGGVVLPRVLVCLCSFIISLCKHSRVPEAGARISNDFILFYEPQCELI